ncbi:MAG: efflux RND transporter periplasmic adaptor subunit [Nitrospirota bacterium]|nr:MAG: efflux RND transporter periplasmic adaptor subunit [Nitrospirota bacterium]
MIDHSKVTKIALPIVIVFAAIAIMFILIKARPAPKKEIKENPGALVEIIEAERTEYQIKLRTNGTVQAQRQITIVPQVSGKVTYMDPRFVEGGFFKDGDLLLRMETADYELAVAQAEAALAQAEVELASEEGNAKLAREEWERISGGKEEDPNPLVLREPQLKRARANVSSAKAALKQAKLNLQRTSIYAPFNCLVSTKSVDIGQYVRAGAGIGTLTGTDSVEIIVPMPVADMGLLEIPHNSIQNGGAKTAISIDLGGKKVEWRGRVIRSSGEIDSKSRMTEIIVRVDDPYGLKNKDKYYSVLSIGMFVDVLIDGITIRDVFVIPRNVLHDGSTIWIAGPDNRLEIRYIEPLLVKDEAVIVKIGLNEGDRLIRTNISGAADGMKIRVSNKGTDQ